MSTTSMRQRRVARATFDDAGVPRRLRERLAEGLASLAAARSQLLRVSIGAAVAWAFSSEALNHVAPVFAPITAMLAIGIAGGQPTRRALEFVFGVAFGIVLADALVHLIGSGIVQMGVLVLLATGGAVLVGGGATFVGEAAVSAVIVVALPNPGTQFGRWTDAVVGAVVALVLTLLIFPARPLRQARRATEPVLEELAGTLRDVADALRRHDHDAAVAALTRARSVTDPWERLHDTVQLGYETARYAPARRHEQEQLRRYVDAAAHLDLAIRGVRILARGVVRAIELEEEVHPRMVRSVEELVDATEALTAHLEGEAEEARELQDATLRAFVDGSYAFEHADGLGASYIAGQVRSTAV
ncbi:MAG: aromatic acid exporter family protein, partial [Thermoleophilia bacterium]|nr:aromatic acid exporter family protein [Thermoleophilia bacterium]